MSRFPEIFMLNSSCSSDPLFGSVQETTELRCVSKHKAFEFVPLWDGHQHSDRSVLVGDNYRSLLALVQIVTEMILNFSCGDDLHSSNSSSPINSRLPILIPIARRWTSRLD